jgi:stage V sporulation protein B
MALYKTTKGSEYIKILAPFFVLFYLEGVLTSSLQAINEAKTNMKISLYGTFIKLVILSTLSLCHIGIYSLVISEIINIIYVVLANFKKLKSKLQ